MTAPMLSSSRFSASRGSSPPSGRRWTPASRPPSPTAVRRYGRLRPSPPARFRHRGRQSVDTGDAVLHLQHGADFADIDVRQIRRLDLLEEEVFQLAGTQDRISGHGSGLGLGTWDLTL